MPLHSTVYPDVVCLAISNDSDAFAEAASFNAFNRAIINGDFVLVPPDAFISVLVATDPAEAAITPAKGLMVVTQDNKNGPKEGGHDSL